MGTQIGSFFKSKYTGQQIENMLDSAANIADQYDAASSYVVGDLVLYNNGLYVCTGATSGTFDPAKWDATTLDEILTNLGATYTDPNSDGNVVVGVDSTVGEKILRSISFPSLTNRYYLPFAQYIRTQLANDPASASFDVDVPDAEEAPMHSTVIKGKTVAVNQLVQNGNFVDTTRWNASSGTLTVSNNVATFTTASGAGNGARLTSNTPLKSGHTYFARFTVTPPASKTITVRVLGQSDSESLVPNTNVSAKTVVEGIATAAADSSYVYFYLNRNTVLAEGDVVLVEKVNITDLTTVFSAAELITIGSSVATFKSSWLTKRGTPLPQFIPYDAGSLATVNGEYRVRGRNLWDEEWEQGAISNGADVASTTMIRSVGYTKIDASKQIYFKLGNLTNKGNLFWYDAEKNFISGSYNYSGTVITPPSNAVFLRFSSGNEYGATYNYDICVNLSDASINGTYFPYYDGGTIDCSTAPLNGFDDTVCDEKDYATGERITRFPLVDLGTLTWTYSSEYGYFTAHVSGLKPHAYTYAKGLLCPIYTLSNVTTSQMPDKSIRYYSDNTDMVLIKDSAYTDAVTFKAAMSGVMLGYEAATPVTTTETPQPVYTQYGYNVFEPVSGGVQSAEVDVTFYENIAGYIDKKLAEG